MVSALKVGVPLSGWGGGLGGGFGGGGWVGGLGGEGRWRSPPDRAVQVRALAGDIVLCFWARHFPFFFLTKKKHLKNNLKKKWAYLKKPPQNISTN